MIKISATTGSGESTVVRWLVGEPDVPERKHSPALAFVPQFGRQQQLGIMGAAWAAAKVKDRQNDSVQIEASTVLHFDTALGAFDFSRSFSRADASKPYPATALVKVRCIEGNEWTEENYADAAITVLEAPLIGSHSVRVRYRIAAGQSTEGSTGTYSWLLAEDGQHLLTEDGRFLAAEDHES